MKTNNVRFLAFVSFVVIFIQSFSMLSFAGYYDVYHYQTAIAFRYKLSGSPAYLYGYYSIVGGDYNGSGGDGAFSSYLIPVGDDSHAYDFYMVSDRPYRFGSYITSSSQQYTEDEVLDYLSLRTGSKSWNYSVSTPGSTGYYVTSVTIANGSKSITDFEIIGQFSEMPFYVLSQADFRPWLEDGFELGKDPSGGGGSSILYDSSIPAPENLKFEEKTKSFGFLEGAKFEHCLTWSNGLASPPLLVRVSGVANAIYNDTGQVVPDSMLYLLPESQTGLKANTGVFTVAADDIKAKLLQGTTLVSMLEYRVQFYRYDVEGTLYVGPISTVHLNYNKLGKFIGYTVTTDRPKDETNLGQTGGMDDYYQDNWTSDGENYDEYDKDGNLIGSGTSDDGSPLDKLLKSLKNIPLLISSFFDSVGQLFSGVGELPSLLSRLFSFLPSEIIALVGLGVTVVIILRILGR